MRKGVASAGSKKGTMGRTAPREQPRTVDIVIDPKKRDDIAPIPEEDPILKQKQEELAEKAEEFKNFDIGAYGKELKEDFESNTNDLEEN